MKRNSIKIKVQTKKEVQCYFNSNKNSSIYQYDLFHDRSAKSLRVLKCVINLKNSGNFRSICTGLNANLARTLTTTAQFPVDEGTLVEVTCSYREAVNKGSSEVTCVTWTNYTYETEPNCEIEGKLNQCCAIHVKTVTLQYFILVSDRTAVLWAIAGTAIVIPIKERNCLTTLMLS